MQSIISKKLETREVKKREIIKATLSSHEHMTQYRFNNEFETVIQLTQSWYSLTYLTWNVIDDINNAFNYEQAKRSCDSFKAEYKQFVAVVYGRGITLHENLWEYFLQCAKLIDEFNTTAYGLIKEMDKYVQGLKTLPDDIDVSDYYETHIKPNLDKLIEIHNTINIGEVYGIKAMTEKSVNHFNSQHIIP